MPAEQVVVKSSKTPGVVAKFAFDFGDNLPGATKKFGEDVVYSSFKQKAKTRLQDYIRSLIDAGKPTAEIVKLGIAWMPGVAAIRLPKDPKEKARALLAKLTPEERADLLKSLK